MRNENSHNTLHSSRNSNSPHSALARVLHALEAAECTPRRVGAHWSSRCPAHNDRTPSLSVGTGKDGRVLLRCRAGCDTGAIIRTLGLRWADLFESRS